jgi:hypothetical protein
MGKGIVPNTGQTLSKAKANVETSYYTSKDRTSTIEYYAKDGDGFNNTSGQNTAPSSNNGTSGNAITGGSGKTYNF